MKLLKKIANNNIVIKFRNFCGIRPVPLNSAYLGENFSISDGFFWRTDNDFTTNFRFSDLLKIFYKKKESNVEIFFYNRNHVFLKRVNLLNIEYSNNIIIDSNFLGGIRDYGIFYIYHKMDGKLKSSIRNSCYTGFSYKNQLESYVHGNCPTTYRALSNNENSHIIKDIVGVSMFQNQKYKLQKFFNNFTKVEIFIHNPASKKIKFKANNLAFVLNSKCSMIVDVSHFKEIELISNCYFLRPLVFNYKNSFIDVHHG
jgi:hypothetical protein